MDPLVFRLKNGATEGTRRIPGPALPRVGYLETLEAAKETPHYNTPLEGPNKGRGVGTGFWFNGSGPACATASVNADGTVSLVEGSPDIGGGRFWLVDPLDGTKEFISGTDEFTVNIALIESASPVLGALHAPALDECYLADGKAAFLIGKDGRRKPIQARALPADGAVVVASRNHRDADTDDFIARHRTVSVTSAGSALKFGLLAKGEADLYPRFGRTMEWDTAAGHAVLTAAGGSVKRLDGTVLEYGKPGLDNPAFVARGVE